MSPAVGRSLATPADLTGMPAANARCMDITAQLANVRGGSTAQFLIRNGLQLLKSGAPEAGEAMFGAFRALGNGAERMQAMMKARPWLGGQSASARLADIANANPIAH